MSTPIDHDQARAAVQSVIEPVLAALDPAMALVIRDPRYLDAEQDAGKMRSRAVLIDGDVSQIGFLQGQPPTWDLEGLFILEIEGLGGDDTARQARVSAARTAVSAEIAAAPRLDGTVTYAEARSFKPEDLKTPGVAISTLNALTIAVQFVSLTQTG